MSHPVTYTAVLPTTDQTVLFVSGLLAARAAAGAPAEVTGRWVATGRRC